MGLEQLFAKRIEQQAADKDKDRGANLREMLSDPSLWKIITVVFEKNGQEALAMKIIQKERLDESEQKEAIAARDQAAEAYKKGSLVFEALHGGNLIKDITAVSPELEELEKMIGVEKLKSLLTKEYFAILSIEDQNSLETLLKKIEEHNKIKKEVGKIKDNLEKLADDFGIALYDLEKVFEIADDVERNKKIKELVSREVSPVKIRDRKSFFNFARRNQAEKGIKDLIQKYEDAFTDNNNAMKEMGGNIRQISLSDKDLNEKISGTIGGKDSGKYSDEEITFKEAAELVRKKREVQTAFEVFKKDQAEEYGKAIGVEGYLWSTFSPSQKGLRVEEFKRKHGIKKKKKGFWGRLIERMITLVS